MDAMTLDLTTLQYVIDVIKVAKLERERFCDFVTIKVLDRLTNQFRDDIENVLAGMDAIANDMIESEITKEPTETKDN